MKKILAVFLVLAAFTAISCNRQGNVKMPETPPDKVVQTYFGLLAEGGRLTNQEALKMVSQKFRHIDPDEFKRWTEGFTAVTKIKVVETILPDKPSKDGDWIATVRLEVRNPSMFSDDFVTTSKINLILDQESGQWKLDIAGDTLDESDFINVKDASIPSS